MVANKEAMQSLSFKTHKRSFMLYNTVPSRKNGSSSVVQPFDVATKENPTLRISSVDETRGLLRWYIL